MTLDLDAIEQRFGAHVRARREHDPATRDVLTLTAEVRRLYAVINRVRDAVNEHRSGPDPDATVPAGAVFAAIYLSARPVTEEHIRRAHEIERLIGPENSQ